MPFCYTAVFMPPGIGRQLEDVEELTSAGARSRVTIIGLLDGRLPAGIGEAEQSVTAIVPSPEAAAHLNPAPGAPVLRIDRVYYDTDGQVVELAVSQFDPAFGCAVSAPERLMRPSTSGPAWPGRHRGLPDNSSGTSAIQPAIAVNDPSPPRPHPHVSRDRVRPAPITATVATPANRSCHVSTSPRRS